MLYIGETLEHLSKRVPRHKSDKKKVQKNTNTKITNGTALALHAHDKDHNFDFENKVILYKGKNTRKRKIHKIND